MVDEIDRSTELAERERAAIVAARVHPGGGIASSGICEDCELPIEPRRLHVLPYTTRCASCARERETDSGQQTWRPR